MFIYFVTTDLKAAQAEAVELGWVQIAINRWVMSDMDGAGRRNDVRFIRSIREFQNIPSGNWFFPGRDLANAVGGDPYEFRKLCEAGTAQWIANPLLGEAGTIELIESIQPPPPPLTDFVSPTVEDPSPLHSIQDIRKKAIAAARKEDHS